MNHSEFLQKTCFDPDRAAFVRHFYSSPMTGEEIENESFRIIDQEAPVHDFSPEEWQIVRRIIHTTADFSVMQMIRFSPDSISSAVHALRSGRPLYADSNMIRSGLSIGRLRTAWPNYGPHSIMCYVSDPEVAREAHQTGLPRSLYAVRKARVALHAGIAIFGNAPIGLLELNRLIIEEGIRPSLVVGMPVGFVHVVESKQELETLDVPYILLSGRRGGSPLAVSIIHALCSIATSQRQT